MSSTYSPDDSIKKTDTLGRIRTPLEKREKILEEFERSGLSASKFAELVGVKYQTLATWLQKRRKKSVVAPMPDSTADPVQWLEAVVNQARPSSSYKALAIYLADDIKLEVTELVQIDLAAALIRTLRKPC